MRLARRANSEGWVARISGSIAGHQLITQAANSDDAGFGSIKFFAQTANIEFDGIGIGRLIESENLVEQFILAENAARPGDQYLQQSQLAPLQLYFTLAHMDRTRGAIHG